MKTIVVQQRALSVQIGPKRVQLPAQKDPDNKPGLWQIIKDSIGKDISKITVPVFFNEPLSILQK